MSDYEYDIFLSYRRLGDASLWIKDHLVPVLTNVLTLELGHDPAIYFDLRMETGATWPIELGRKLSRSRIMICLWSQNYLDSAWCRQELNQMWHREKLLQLRTPAKPNGLVAMSIINDGETIPKDLQNIQTCEIAKFYNPMMHQNSPKREYFYDEMMAHAEGLLQMIQDAPPYQKEWELAAARDFHETFVRRQSPTQTTPPRYTK